MLWLFLSLLAAAANACYYIAAKKALETLDARALAAGSFLTCGCFLLILSLIGGIPPAGDQLLMAVAATTALNVIGTTLVFRALSSTDISLSVPMIALTPVFLIATSFLLLHEIPSFFGICGICITVAGAYILYLHGPVTQYWEPFRAILKNPGSRAMLLVALIYAFALGFDKITVLNSDPVFGSALTSLAIGSAFAGIWLGTALIGRFRKGTETRSGSAATGRADPARTWAGYGGAGAILAIIGIGILLVIESVSVNYAYMMQIVPYIAAIKRMSIILIVCYGTLVAHEGKVARRITGSVLMAVGAAIIILSG